MRNREVVEIRMVMKDPDFLLYDNSQEYLLHRLMVGNPPEERDQLCDYRSNTNGGFANSLHTTWMNIS